MKKQSLSVSSPQLFEVAEQLSEYPKEPSKRQHDGFVFTFMDVLTAPIITHCIHWADSIPQRLRGIICSARMMTLMTHEELASYPEVVAFMITAALEAPMSHDWTEIYIHVGCTVAQQWFNEDHWDELKAPRQLNESQNRKLIDLRRFIYNKRRQYVKDRIKAEQKEETTTQTLTPTPHKPTSQQTTFSFYD
ncbi:hypothetical protein [Paraflavitalea sp. CAU 1676]|uniref:hypothetical protein n=1 Tax=Paraflavitalea sp. CAU 1676 TaxID=3032598 RepID=UPI0023DB5DEA|nr:hypothetical protein [Paraflavitalea sp. CAU 1676]MDF2191378.1 hypothetical protein [Paraflavitalea sp. CAU 1676]